MHISIQVRERCTSCNALLNPRSIDPSLDPTTARPLQPTHSKISHQIHAMSPSSFDPSSLKRAFPNPPDLFADSEHPVVARASVGDDPRDGIHICNCNRESKLTLYLGNHPFGNVMCDMCEKPPHRFSKLSDVMMPIYGWTERFAAVKHDDDFKDQNVPYGAICWHCGLTHRAIAYEDKDGGPDVTLDFGDLTCSCSTEFDNTWVRFYIGSPRSYHRDPVKAYQGMSEQNAEFATGILNYRYSQITNLTETPACTSVYRWGDHRGFVTKREQTQSQTSQIFSRAIWKALNSPRCETTDWDSEVDYTNNLISPPGSTVSKLPRLAELQELVRHPRRAIPPIPLPPRPEWMQRPLFSPPPYWRSSRPRSSATSRPSATPPRSGNVPTPVFSGPPGRHAILRRSPLPPGETRISQALRAESMKIAAWAAKKKAKQP
jgi:hypothetical protein